MTDLLLNELITRNTTISAPPSAFGHSTDPDGRRIYWALAYDATQVDRHGTTMSPDALRDSADGLGFPILVFHESDRFPVGKPVAVEHTIDGTWVGFVFADTPEARTAEALVAGGFLRGVSVGFIPLSGYWDEEREDVYVYTRVDLVELSLTPTPSSKGALIDLKRSVDSLVAEQADEADAAVETPAVDEAREGCCGACPCQVDIGTDDEPTVDVVEDDAAATVTVSGDALALLGLLD